MISIRLRMFCSEDCQQSLVKIPGFLLYMGLILIVLILFTKPAVSSDKPSLMLLKTYQPGLVVNGWVMSEKLDGVRAYWDGKQLMSRQGNVFNSPKWFTQNFPPFELDGELWFDRGEFEETVSIVRQQIPDKRWKQITYNIFEVPNQRGGLFERLSILKSFLKQNLKQNPNSFIKIIEQKKIHSNQEVDNKLTQILAIGGEGLVLRNPNKPYQTGRLNSALKLKQRLDAECVVKDYTPGKGKYQGKVGAIVCELIPEQVQRLFSKLSVKNKVVIKIGSGLSDAQRAHPPKIGTTITFQYMGLTKKGLPRFPVFLRERLLLP